MLPLRLLVPETLRTATPKVVAANTPLPVTTRLLAPPVTPPVKVTVEPVKVRVAAKSASNQWVLGHCPKEKI